jgi:exopolysaccharide biosynthesis polyprenyl glycosylphosphotransferase
VTQRKELLFLVLGDFFALNFAWIVFYWLRTSSGWFVFHNVHTDITLDQLPLTALWIYAFWMVMFIFFGLYRPWYVRAPFDEIVTILKTLCVGTILLSVVMWWDPTDTMNATPNDPRILGLTYWLITVIFCVGIRSLIRYGQRRLLESGVGTRPSIIIGDLEKVRDLAARVAHYPRLGYDVVGFVSSQTETPVAGNPTSFTIEQRNGRRKTGPKIRNVAQLGTTEELEAVIDRYGVKEVLIALGSNEHEKLIDVIARASKSNAGLKIVPDLYDIVSGQARAREIYGFPLIDINPVLLRPWEEAAKRTLDIVVSSLVITLGSPVWAMTALTIRLTSKGPLIYSQERVGKEGRHFRIFKFRSMYIDAEAGGPVWASKNDPRVTPLGRFLRRSHLDEVPQFWNVLRGDMSLVGPRPERQFFVRQLIQEIPYYNRRHKVRPGITGLYQAMIDKYDENIDDVKQRVKYDLMYIESMSFRLDVKILFRTAYMMLRGKGQA